MKSIALMVLVGCGSATEPLDDHKLHGGVEETAESVRIRYAGRAVPVADIPAVAAGVGLPVTGTADVTIDITVPKARGRAADYKRATGTIDVSCKSCKLGDDVAKLELKPRSGRTSAFAGEGLEFGHLVFDAVEARFQLADGRAELVHWRVQSPDLKLELALTLELATRFEDSQLEGCIRFDGTPELARRDPKMTSLLMLTGASRGDDGLYHITLRGTVGNRKLLPTLCGAR